MSAHYDRWPLVKEDRIISEVCECTPLVYDARLLLLECLRPKAGASGEEHYLTISDAATGRRLARFGDGYGLACALIHEDTFYVYASRREPDSWNDVTLFSSQDLRKWEARKVVEQDEGEQLFNSSVCRDEPGFLMVYETNDRAYVPFSLKFARSQDLVHWRKVPDLVFGADRYAACPCLRYVNGYYYMLYLERVPGEWRFETYLTRSADLKNWEASPLNPVLAPGPGEDINTSDPDLVQFEGQVYLYYSFGDQRTYSRLKRARFAGSLDQFFDWFYPD